MRLKSLKMSGFKSFVDATTFKFPTNLSSVVGPNGCGKSNTIDAVRWVMGERSAKHLRGDSMADVIFNGAKTRKPVGQANVELIFDNSDGRIQGQYAAYNEISVKRTVSREGLSTYFLNGTKCRRRDIMDLFLGTGLGPRSYAIIEQGMISKMIEAKPEELRGMIEEAAGISKYKERRRDTENRIRHTKDNLGRINDLRDEIQKQINRLERQVGAAKKYKEFKSVERKLKSELMSLKWQEQNNKHLEWHSSIQTAEVTLEAGLSELQTKITELEKINQTHIIGSDNLAKVQAEYYQSNSEISSTEQTLKSSKERVTQTTEDLESIKTRLKKNLQTQQDDQNTVTELSGWIESNTTKLQTFLAAKEDTNKAKVKTESKWADWQTLWNKLQQDILKPEQNSSFEQAKIQQLEAQQTQLTTRKKRIIEQLANQPESTQNNQSLMVTLELGQTKLTALQKSEVELNQNISDLRQKTQTLNTALDNLKKQFVECSGRIESLETLQKNALGKNDDQLNDWLKNNQLTGTKRLFENLQVKPGWEHAIQICLTDFAHALCISSDPKVLDSSDFNVSFLNLNKSIKASQYNGKTINDVLKDGSNLGNTFSHIYVAETRNEAFEIREDLSSGESVISKDGLWLGPNWVRKVAEQKTQNNTLKREQLIKQEKSKHQNLETQIKQQQTEQKILQEKTNTLEQELVTIRSNNSLAHSELAKLQAKKSAIDASSAQIKTREIQLKQELSETTTLVEDAETEINGARQSLSSAISIMHKVADEKLKIESEKDSLHGSFLQARQAADVALNQHHILAIEFESKQSRLTEINHHALRINSQNTEEQEQAHLLQTRLDNAKSPILEMETKLQSMLESQGSINKKLSETKTALSDIEHDKNLKQQIQRQIEDNILQARSKLENLRLQAQEAKVRATTLAEQLQLKNIEPQEHLQHLSDEANIKTWQDEIDTMARKIERLGAINLAAIEEFKTESERKLYIDRQHADLTEALETLQAAIAKIDKETKTRFTETYDKINSGLQKNFPILFGGGKASLDLTSDDLLEAGVNIMAQPPGKRNSTIHLLSGGEKAMTAVALVFAIFELNPAPFCMLDEVDAPLDDTNVERFCQMVKEMSKTIQFIIVTHNKITMELADQLTGVTMQESGVSRMVAVNLDEAAKMVDN